MSESFAELLDESLANLELKNGALIPAEVIDIDRDSVVVNAGLKSEGVIPVREFYDENGELEIKVGDIVEVALEAVEDGYGQTVLSREKAREVKKWAELEEAFEKGEPVVGTLTEKVRGGYIVMLGDIRAFLPGSLVDVRQVRDSTHLEGKEHEVKVIKLDRKRDNVVVSRRAVVEQSYLAERAKLLESLEEGQVKKGVVKNLTDYGAFVDLGGIDGLLHVTDMAWRRVRHPSEVVNVGDEIDVMVLKYDKERTRVSLGLKQLGDDPWKDIARRYPVATRLVGKVTNVTEYGCFVELEDGVEGLVHMSEMDWTNRNVHPNKLVQSGDEVEVMVLDIDENRRRISLGMKQCKVNPWEEFSALHKKGDVIKGTIKSMTDFGLFVELDGGIDGLVHVSDIAWDLDGEEAISGYKVGDEVEAMVLLVDADRERISLGIKQLGTDPFSEYLAANGKGSVVSGEVIAVEPAGATVKLAEEVEGYIKVGDIAQERVNDATTALKVGDKVEALVVRVDSKSRQLQLSIRAKDDKEQREAVSEYKNTDAVGATTSLGDLLKEQLKNQEK